MHSRGRRGTMPPMHPGLTALVLQTHAGRHELAASWCLSPEHPILVGHFPGAPLVPGVLLLDVVRAAWERALARPFGIREVTNVRFFQPVLPGETVTLSASAVADGAADLDVEGQWLGEAGRIATFHLRLGPPHA